MCKSALGRTLYHSAISSPLLPPSAAIVDSQTLAGKSYVAWEAGAEERGQADFGEGEQDVFRFDDAQEFRIDHVLPAAAAASAHCRGGGEVDDGSDDDLFVIAPQHAVLSPSRAPSSSSW